MAVAVALWSLALKPGEKEVLIPQSDLRITNVALGHELADESGRTSVKFTYNTPVQVNDSDDEEDAEPLSTTVLCSLTPYKIEQATVDVIFEQDDEIVFESVGKNTVYLTGNYIDQTPPDNVPYNDLSDDSDDEELDSDASRFEEILDAEAKKPTKRPHDLDAMETDDAKLSKNEKKKLNKKLKNEDGKAVAPPATAEADKKEQKPKKEKPKKEEGAPKSKDIPEKELTGGIKIKDVKVGDGPQAKKGNTVSMRYIGKLQNGKVFDKNTSGKPFTFHLGKGEVIKGWDEGIAGMSVGGERLLTIPPNMGYGKKKMQDIPANSTLIFECKLVNIK